MGLPAARRRRSAAFASNAAKSTTAKGGSRSLVAKSYTVALVTRSKVRHEGLKREYYSLTVSALTDEGCARMTRWTNWAGTASASPQHVHQPRNPAEIAAT